MKGILSARKIGTVLFLTVLIFGFLLFYSQTGEWIGSLVAATLSAALVWVSFVMIQWLVQVFKK